MKIGLDIHGVIDRYPEQFRDMSRTLMANGHEVYIITGQPWKQVAHTVAKAGVNYTDTFSIVDYHRKDKDTKMWKDKNGTWWMDEKVWIRSKGDYIERMGIDVHFDDSYEYAEYVPNSCTFVLVPKKGLDKFFKLCSNMV